LQKGARVSCEPTFSARGQFADRLSLGESLIAVAANKVGLEG
jgi:hypothetical protein